MWFLFVFSWRRGSGSNRRIKVLQTFALPLGYRAVREGSKCKVPRPEPGSQSPNSGASKPGAEALTETEKTMACPTTLSAILSKGHQGVHPGRPEGRYVAGQCGKRAQRNGRGEERHGIQRTHFD